MESSRCPLRPGRNVSWLESRRGLRLPRRRCRLRDGFPTPPEGPIHARSCLIDRAVLPLATRPRLALVLALGLLPAGLRGQGVTTAAVGGRVVDSGGLAVPDVAIELRQAETGAVAQATTDAAGRFFLPNLRPGGPYTLVAHRIGFAEARREEIRLRLGQTLEVEVTLTTEAVPLPEISVRLQTDPEFDPSRMGAQTVIEAPELERLPTISRDFLEFAQLSPLVKVDEQGVSVAGSNLRFNNIQVDGALNQDVFGLSPTGVAGGQAGGRIIPLGAIQELQVLVAPYDVRQSGFTGGVLNAVTRTGTNEWEGSGFAFFRDQALVGDLIVDDVARTPEIQNLYGGFTLGGPIVKDRLHLFTAAEFERRRRPPDGFEVGVDDPYRTQIAPDSMARFEEILSGYGVDPGASGTVRLDNTLVNLFGRLDLEIDERNSVMARFNFASAEDDPAPNRLPGDAYELSSNGTQLSNRNYSVVAQWLGELGGGVSNDLLVNAQFLRDREYPNSRYPRVEVDITSQQDEYFLTRTVRAGADFFAQASGLDQDIYQITDALTLGLGSHRVSVGGTFERFDMSRVFLPGLLGTYRFDSLEEFEANRPARYDVNLASTPGDPSVRFSVNQWAGFVQDEWRIGEALNVRFGLRVDLPVIPSSPGFNTELEEDLGIDTSRMPSGHPLFSPRLGFNLGLGPDRSTQIRGGAGLFTGRPAFAWLANAFQFDGSRSRFLTCERVIENPQGDTPTIIEVAPPFDPGGPSPAACLEGREEFARETDVIDAFDPDYRFPQDFKISLAIDQRLPLGIIGSVEGVYTKAVNQTFVRELNLAEPLADSEVVDQPGYPDGMGFGQRTTYGLPVPEGFEPRRVSDRFGSVVEITNRSDNFAYALSGTFRKRFGDRASLSAGYSFTRSSDIQSLVALDATSNLGLTPIEGDPSDPLRQPSLFDRPHKIVASGSLRILERLGGTEIALLYVGQSGAPYSYVYRGDVNGDGFPGDALALDLSNDLVYVPVGLSDFPTGGVSNLLLESLIAQEPCLEAARGTMVTRNACRAPWSHQLDLRLTQNVRLGSASAQVYLDMLNVLNFLSSDWGLVERANPVVQILKLDGRFPLDSSTGPLAVRYQGPLVATEDGGRRAVRPTVASVPDSQWQAQLGVRIRLR